jgi:hypothetical protein
MFNHACILTCARLLSSAAAPQNPVCIGIWPMHTGGNQLNIPDQICGRLVSRRPIHVLGTGMPEWCRPLAGLGRMTGGAPTRLWSMKARKRGMSKRHHAWAPMGGLHDHGGQTRGSRRQLERECRGCGERHSQVWPLSLYRRRWENRIKKETRKKGSSARSAPAIVGVEIPFWGLLEGKGGRYTLVGDFELDGLLAPHAKEEVFVYGRLASGS